MNFLSTTLSILLLCNFTITYSTQENEDSLAATISHLSKKWQLDGLEQIVYSWLFDNYIGVAYSSLYQQQVVLKICQSDNDESQALKLLQGEGIVKLLDHDDKYKALLLEYITPQGEFADFVTKHDDNWIIDQFIELFQKIHAIPKIVDSYDFQHVTDHFSIIKTNTFTKIPAHLIEKAQAIYDELIASNDPAYLLHFDLHFNNILKIEDTFIAIDPWAAVGPLESEVAVFLVSPADFILAQDDPQAFLHNRLDRLSEVLHLNKELLKKCGFMRVMLIACLCELRNKDSDWIAERLRVAELIDQLDSK
ncbi:hypothetical protein KBC04_05400 [Candidatus Babeliales bacterium]|nr:hypothetical protein [Candidatus Babeliales bacterium]MBP9844369.1 hypothetical protein [Candidatus Babeliales bacterium]